MPNFTENILSRSQKSQCSNYRFYLLKRWDTTKSIVVFIGINPSKADELFWDPTVCNCNNLAIQWGYGGFIMLNLYPIYQTSPKGITKKSSVNNYQYRNDRTVERICKINIVDKVIIATGINKIRDTNSIMNRINLNKLYCISKNSRGGYLHPAPQALGDYTKYHQPLKI